MTEKEDLNSDIKEFSEDSLKSIAKEIVIRRLFVNTHITVYVCVNLLLIAINFFTHNPYWWALWASTGWGAGLLIHIFSYYIFKKGLFSEPGQSFLAYHIFIFLIVSGLLIFIDGFSLQDWNFDWFLYPILSWALALVIHIALYKIYGTVKGDSFGISWLENKINKELEKSKGKM